MKANELRIGNFYDNFGRVEKVTPEIILNVWEATRSWCKPIPLTEEWLLKFGFDIKYTNYDGGNHYYLLIKDEIRLLTDFCDFTSVWLDGINVHVEYVHQLQNLYFALTGEEIELKS